MKDLFEIYTCIVLEYAKNKKMSIFKKLSVCMWTHRLDLSQSHKSVYVYRATITVSRMISDTPRDGEKRVV